MRKRVCIAGAGTGGLLLAKKLAECGFEVIVLESLSKEEYDDRYHWSDAVYLHTLKDAGLPVPYPDGARWRGPGVKGEDSGLDLYHPSRVSEFAMYSPDYKLQSDVVPNLRCVLTDRAALQKYQLQLALEAGAEVRFGCCVTGLLGKNSAQLNEIEVTGVRCEGPGGEEILTADIVVDDSGARSSVRALLDAPEIGKPVDPRLCAKVYRSTRRVDTIYIDAQNADWEHPPVRHHGRLRSTKGLFWMHTFDHDRLDAAGGAATMEAAKGMVNDFLSKLPGVHEETGYAEEDFFSFLPPDALVTNGFLVIGHSAFQVLPANGCGIAQAYAAAMLAFQVLKRAKRFDIYTLWEYAYRYKIERGAHYIGIASKMLSGLTPEEIEFLLSHQIFTGESRSRDLMEVYIGPDINVVRRLDAAYAENPDLITRFLQAEAKCQKMHEHLQQYPPRWDRFEWIKWRTFSPNK